MPTRNKLLLAGIILLFILTGFFREHVFLNWNEQMRVTYYNSPDPHVSPSMQWLSAFDYATLYYLKWPLTLLFSVLFAAYAVAAVQLAFGNKKYNRITWLAYAGVFTLSFLFFATGWLLNNREGTYVISRFLAGMIETPAMLAVLMASFLVHRRF
jgi:hypothetical protein